jgi:hypothetical protein
MPARLDITGIRFGKLIVLSRSHQDRFSAYHWKCKCECGNETIIHGSHLNRGITKSCGCGIALTASLPRTHGATYTPLYRRWRAILARTKNPHNSNFRNYGGRGIEVCKRWEKFENFRDDMSCTFEPHLEIERMDVNGNYSPENCKWATKAEQSLNKRTNHRIEWRDETLTVQEWGQRLGIKPNTIIFRLRRGWSIDRALLEVAN